MYREIGHYPQQRSLGGILASVVSRDLLNLAEENSPAV